MSQPQVLAIRATGKATPVAGRSSRHPGAQKIATHAARQGAPHRAAPTRGTRVATGRLVPVNRAILVSTLGALAAVSCSHVLDGDDFRRPPADGGVMTADEGDTPGPHCGDGSCAGDESSCGCPEDCGGAVCGDEICCEAAGESSCSCTVDCGALCGDGCCNADETTVTCPTDCGDACGDMACGSTESTATCPADCGSACGDGACNADEDACSCDQDCPPTCEPSERRCCGDGLCCGGEKHQCAADCSDD